MTATPGVLLGLALATAAPAAADVELPFPCAKVQATQQVTRRKPDPPAAPLRMRALLQTRANR